MFPQVQRVPAGSAGIPTHPAAGTQPLSRFLRHNVRLESFADLSPNTRRALLALFTAACAVIVLAGARAAANLLNTVLMAGFLALLLQPLLHRLRWLGGGAVAVVVLCVILGGLALFGFVGVSLRQLAVELPRYHHEFQALLASITRQLAERGINIAGYIESALTGPAVAGAVLSVSRAVAGGVGNLVLTLFIFGFMLGGMWELERRASRQALDHSPLAARFLAFAGTIRSYMAARTVLGLAAALLNYMLLLIVGVDHALLWAVLSFLLSFVPNIGFVLSMLPPMLLALLSGGWVSALIVFAGYQLINTLLDNIIGPRYIGRQLRISALLSFLSVIFWAWVLGPTGAILAVPLTLLIQQLAFGPVDHPGPDGPRPATTSATPAP
jgi:predicted PurR-regulated permease PerM